MGKRIRARKKSCIRPRRFTKPKPASETTLSGSRSAVARASQLVGRPPQAELTHHVTVVAPRTQVVASRSGVGSAQQPLVVPLHGALHGVEQLGPTLWSRPDSESSCSVIPARSARNRTASTKSRCSMARTKLMASPDAWHPKQ